MWETDCMPLLRPVGFNKNRQAVLWMCSLCEAAFAPDRITPNFSTSVLRKINDNFRIHCERLHKGQKVRGLDIPKLEEDSSQAALRVVRESTENK